MGKIPYFDLLFDYDNVIGFNSTYRSVFYSLGFS